MQFRRHGRLAPLDRQLKAAQSEISRRDGLRASLGAARDRLASLRQNPAPDKATLADEVARLEQRIASESEQLTALDDVDQRYDQALAEKRRVLKEVDPGVGRQLDALAQRDLELAAQASSLLVTIGEVQRAQTAGKEVLRVLTESSYISIISGLIAASRRARTFGRARQQLTALKMQLAHVDTRTAALEAASPDALELPHDTDKTLRLSTGDKVLYWFAGPLYEVSLKYRIAPLQARVEQVITELSRRVELLEAALEAANQQRASGQRKERELVEQY